MRLFLLTLLLTSRAFACSDYPTTGQAFYQTLYPSIQIVNQEKMKEQKEIRQAFDIWQKEHLSPHPNLLSIAKRYHTLPLNQASQWHALLRRAKPIPPAIVLAQAALESSYGRAHLAQESCNIFGLWCYKEGCGIVPKHRPKNRHYAVASYPSIHENLTAYYHNLNTHKAYQTFRLLRAQHASIPELVATLTAYASIGKAYPKRLMRIIHRDHLEQYV